MSTNHRRAMTRRRGSVTVSQVQAEGVLELGRVAETSVLFVRTQQGARLFHAETLRGIR